MNGLYKRVSGTFLIKVLGLGIAFIFQIVLSRVLGVEEYGQYTIFITYINVLLIIAVLGMDRNLIKEIAKVSNDKIKSRNLLSFSIKVSVALFFFISIFVYLFKKGLDIPSNMVHLFLFMLLIKMLIAIFDGFLQGVGLVVKVTFLNDLLNNFLKVLFFIILISLNMKGLHVALYSFIGSEIITLLLRMKIVSKLIGRPLNLKDDFSLSEKSKFMKYSITVALIAGIGLLLQNVDKIMIARLLDLSNVGIYKVTQNYVSLISVFVAPFVAFWPIISKLYNENKISEIENEMKKIVKIVIYLVIPMFFIFLFLGENLLLIFGEAYTTKQAQKVLIILAFAFLVDAISGPIGSILTMTNYARYILINNIICLFLNIIFNFIFIKIFGIVGVAIATAISIISNNLISIIEVKLLLGIFSYDYKNLIQIISFSLINYVSSIWLIKIISLNNNYLNIIVFSISLYLINLCIVIFINRKVIIEKFSRKKVI